VKKLKSLLSITLVLVLLAGFMPATLAVSEPTVAISQQATEYPSVNKLVMTVTLPESAGPITTVSLSMSYDNTVIIPVDASTGAPIMVVMTSQTTPFKTPLAFGFMAPSNLWETSSERTRFDTVASDFAGKDASFGIDAIEFYFTLADGKADSDINKGTFMLEIGHINNCNASIGLMDTTEFHLGHTSNLDSIDLESFTYTNSEVRPIGTLAIDPIAAITVPDLFALNVDTPMTTPITSALPTLIIEDIWGDDIDEDDINYPAITWSITSNPDADRISINSSTGVISVAPGATAGTVTIMADAGSNIKATQDIVVSRNTAVATLININGASNIAVPTTGTETETYTATILDQYGSVFSGAVTWSEVASSAGVSFNATTSLVTVDNTAATYPVSYQIKAVAGSAETIKTITISREAAIPTTLTVSGGQVDIIIPADGAADALSTAFTATVLDQYGDAYNGTINWSISPIVGVSIGFDGVVTVSNNTKSAITDIFGLPLTITATLDGTTVSGTGNIVVKRAMAVPVSMEVYKGSDTTAITADTITIPASGSPNTTTYNAKTYDQYGSEFSDNYAYTLTATGAADANVTNSGATVSVAVGATDGGTFNFLISSNADASIMTTVSISIKDIEIIWPTITSISNPVYGDSWNEIITLSGGSAALAATNVPGMFYISDSSGTPIGSNCPNAGVGISYYVTFKSDNDSYTIISSVESVSINPKPITLSISAETREYGAANPSFSIVTPVSGVLVGSDTVVDLGLNLTTLATATSSPGNYEITGTASNTNYDVTIAPNTALTVTKATLTLTGTPSFASIFANNSSNASEAALISAVQAANSTLAATYINGSETLDAIWSLSSATPFNPKGSSYTFIATLTPSDNNNFNYSGSDATFTVIVNPVNGTYLYTPATLLKAKSEIDAAINMAALGLPTSISVSYDNSVSGDTYSISAWSYTLSELKTIDVTITDQIIDLIPTVDFPVWATIDLSGLKTELTITNKYLVTVSITPPSDIIYGNTLGDSTAAQIDIGNGIEASPSWSYLYSGTTRNGTAYNSSSKPIVAGTYTVTATLVSDTYYGSETSTSFTISPKALNAGMISISGAYSFSGNAIVPVYAITDGTLLNESDYNIALTNNINAGTANLAATATATGNYTGTATQSFTIDKASAPSINPISREHLTNAASTGVIDISALLPANRGATTYAFDSVNTGESIAISSINATTGEFAYTTVNTATATSLSIDIKATMINYSDAILTVTISIVDKTIPVIIGIPTISGTMNYGQPLNTLSISAQFDDGMGTVVDGIIDWDSPTIVPDAGTQAVPWTFTPTDFTMFASVTDTVSITIGKSVPLGTPIINTISQAGQTLADANLSPPSAGFVNPYDNAIIVLGTLTWDAGDSQVVIANTDYNWTFTPADLSKYEIINGSFRPYTTSGGSGSGSGGSGGSGGGSGGSSVIDSTDTPTASGDGVADDSLPGGSTVLTPGNQPPVKNNDGSVTLSGGGTITTENESTIEVPSGTVVNQDGSITIPIGSDGAVITNSDGTTIQVGPGLTIMLPVGDMPLRSNDIIWNNPFIDVRESDWFYEDVKYTYTHGLTNGTSANTFSPRAPLTRGMLVTILYRQIGEPDVSNVNNPFNDVGMAYYTNPIIWAVANGIVNGYASGRFGPSDPISRQDLVVILLRFAQYMDYELPKERDAMVFPDDAVISDYAKSAVAALYQAGIINGKEDGNFDPLGNATRAEVAAMLNRFFDAVS